VQPEETVPAGFVPGIPIREVRVRVQSSPLPPAQWEVAGETVTVGTAPNNALVLSDETVSRYHLEVSCSGDRVLVRDLGSTNGTTVGRVELREGAVSVAPGATIQIGSTVLGLDHGVTTSVETSPTETLGELRGRSPVMRRVMGLAHNVASRDVSVLITGESGTGKELLARAIHDESPRRDGAFVVVDCGAIPAHLVASELFGHERGAFTGADRRHAGAFERAHGGTLFLDEIGELPLEVQPALLGALERRSFRRVGGSDEVSADFRLVAATHRDLRAAVNSGAFRLDLYHRIAVVTLELPPLRDRPEDVPLLVEHFLRQEGHDGPVGEVFDAAAMQRLKQRRWEGNARELRNHVTATLSIGAEPPALPEAAATGSADVIDQVIGLTYKDARRVLTDAFEARYLRALLERSGGNVRQAARLARMDRSYLIELLRRHGLSGG
jgi:DNA-binding NtrC family response regulator